MKTHRLESQDSPVSSRATKRHFVPAGDHAKHSKARDSKRRNEAVIGTMTGIDDEMMGGGDTDLEINIVVLIVATSSAQNVDLTL